MTVSTAGSDEAATRGNGVAPCERSATGSDAGSGPEAGTAMAQHVLMLGCGKMGGALLQRWSAATPFHFTALSPSGTRRLPDSVTMVTSADGLDRDLYDVIIIAVKPQMIREVLPAYIGRLAAGGLVVSLAAGTSCQSIAALAGGHALVRVMPNLPVSIGLGMSGLYAGDNVTAEHRRFIEVLMGPTGELLWAESEDELDRITAIAGSGPGYTFELLRCWAEAAEGLGFTPDQARGLVLATVRGAVELAQERDLPLAELRTEVTSRKGTTEAGLRALNEDGEMTRRFERTLQAAYDRAIELR
jgi:pyrroline-5-carboxylate reductase